MTSKEWAGVCGINRITYAMKRQIVAAEVCSHLDIDRRRRVSIRPLRLDRWHDCQSLFLDMRQVKEAVEVFPVKVEQMGLAGSKMPDLHCMHVIGGGGWYPRGANIEGVLINLLAKRALVLTVQVHIAVLPMPLQLPLGLSLPNLQHLVLGLHPPYDIYRFYDGLSKAISNLTGLKTIYIQSLKATSNLLADPDKCVDLKDCKTLQRLVVQGVILSRAIALPAGCLLQAISKTVPIKEVTSEVESCVTGVLLRQSSPSELGQQNWWYDNSLLRGLPRMQRLRQLRISLDKGVLKKRCSAPSELRLNFDRLPCLEVLELDVQGDLAIYVSPQNGLKVLVVIASGALYMSDL